MKSLVENNEHVYFVAATVNHSLAFTTSYSIARNAFQDDIAAGKISVL